MMRAVEHDEKTLAHVLALCGCLAVYLLGVLTLFGLDAIFRFNDGVDELLNVVLLMGSLMAAVVVLLRDKSRQTPRR
jgi:hypothetical protein